MSDQYGSRYDVTKMVIPTPAKMEQKMVNIQIPAVVD
jgi:hypothetical protein